MACVLPLVSALVFPWQATVVLALGAAFFEPLMPLATGLLLDVLYYVPQTTLWPRFTLFGALVSVVALVVRSRLRTRRTS